MRIADLRKRFPIALPELEAELGRFALIQRPPDPVLAKVAMQLAHARTVSMAHRNRLAEQIMAMLHSFENFLVIGGLAGGAAVELEVGRQPGARVVVHDPSVSGKHAMLRWDGSRGFVRDLGSTNGTFVNAREIYEEQPLIDGDTISFGDAHFLFLLTPTVHNQLSNLADFGDEGS